MRKKRKVDRWRVYLIRVSDGPQKPCSWTIVRLFEGPTVIGCKPNWIKNGIEQMIDEIQITTMILMARERLETV